MKIKLLPIIFTLLILTSCSLSNDTNNSPINVKIVWSLTHITGGIAGVDEQFDLNTIIWEFDEVNDELLVFNDNTDDTIEDGLDSGTYAFSIIEANNESYLVIETNEFGLLTINSNVLTIDQNELSTGSGADGFLYTFQSVEVTVN